MSGHRIEELLSRVPRPAHETPHLLAQLTEEVGPVRVIDNLDTRIHDLRSILDGASLEPYAQVPALHVGRLTDELALSSRYEPGRQHLVPIISWREMANVSENGTYARALPEWAPAAFRQVTGILAGEGFPCIFARQANHLKSGWFCFVDSIETGAGREIVKEVLLAYIGTVKGYPRTRATIMPLMIVVKPRYPMLSLKEYRDHAWGLFQYLHDNDPEPWLPDVPTDPERGDWTLCFGGIQLFSNVSDPAHQVHKSRNLGDSLVFAMQPRTNFDLVGGNNPKGRQVRKEIRERAERYEGRPAASHLGFYGSPENREWLQMATKDSEADHDYPKACPFKFRAGKAPTEK